MTRINLVNPKELSRQHLVAEYREITRLPNNLEKSLNRKSSKFTIKEIPPKYVLGKGHVKFFYNKMLFLKRRYEDLIKEMHSRGYNPKFTDSSIFENCPQEYLNDYNPSKKEIDLNKKRIKERS